MRSLSVLVTCLGLCAIAAPSLAQDGQKPPAAPGGGAQGRPNGRPGGGPGGPGGGGGAQALSAEQAKAAWELQAKSVASGFGLNDEKTAAVVKAYIAARESQNAASEKMRQEMRDKNAGGGGGGGGADMREQMDKMNKAEREKLEKALTGPMTADQAKKAMDTLGSFNRPWDNMVDTLAGFKLEAKKQADAFKAVEAFVVATGKARDPNADREAMRTAMQDARKDLTASLKKVLTDEQMTKFEASLGQGGRGGGGGRGPRGGGDGEAPPPPPSGGKPGGGK